jgi:predicted nucleic acid-binding Zn ribbon protein
MAVAMRLAPTRRPCLGCGQLVDDDAVFCSACGTRQIPDRPVVTYERETERLARSTNAWILVGLAAGALILLAVWMVMGI